MQIQQLIPYKNALKHFNCKIVDDVVVYKNQKIVMVEGRFDINTNVEKFLVQHYDSFNFDVVFQAIKENPECLSFIEMLKQSFDTYIDDIKNMPIEDLERLPLLNIDETINHFKEKVQIFNNALSKNSWLTKAEKLYIISVFTRFKIVDQLKLNDKRCFLYFDYPNWVSMNEEILTLVGLEDFELDIDYCDWSLDKDDTLILNFKYKGE